MTLSFGGRDNNFNSFKDAKAVILPVPYGRTVSYRKGTENAPASILKASDNIELFDEELKEEIYKIGINTQPLLKVNKLRPERMLSVVENKVRDILKKDKLPVLLGGEHLITVGSVKAMKERYKDLSILYFDAHYDLRDRYRGSKYNHACTARRLLEMAPVVEVGVRSLSKEEDDFLKVKDIKVITRMDMIKMPDWENIVREHLSKNVYISIDLDVFDPSIMSAVTNPEPGGVNWHEFLKAMRNIIADKTIVGFDVVELCPIKDMVASDFMAARLIYKMLGYIFFPAK